MNSSKSLLTLPVVIALSILACNIGVQTPTTNPNQAAATIVAMTLIAQGLPTSPGFVATPSASQVTASPAAATPTVKPTLHINANNAACRSGPSPDSKVIASFPSNTTLDLIGQDLADSFWLVNDPGGGGLCWVQALDATPGGSFSTLPEVTPQATVAGLPENPSIFYPNYSCDATSLTTRLTWNDAANNENGYRVYRDDKQVADLPTNSTTYSETIDFTLGSQITYAVEAYNDAGASPQKTLTFQCP